MPRGRRSSKPSQGQAYQNYERLKKEYDAERGGYTVPGAGPVRGRNQGSEAGFVPSKFTPEQGGYYADQGTTTGIGRARRRTGGDYYNADMAKAITDWAGEDKRRTSAAKPFQRVDPSVVASRRSRKRQRAAASGRGSTVMTRRLGAAGDDERTRKRTLLGS